MKFTTKNTVSEIIIDMEDGCVLRLTKYNIEEISMSEFDRYSWTTLVTLKNGISFKIKVENNSNLLKELSMLVNY